MVRTGQISTLPGTWGSPSDRGAILDILTAQVRAHAPWPPRLPGQYIATAPIERIPPLAVRAVDAQAIMTVLGRWPPNRDRPLLLSNVDLRVADLRDAHLEGAILGGTHLEQANLSGANLRKAYLRDAHLAVLR